MKIARELGMSDKAKNQVVYIDTLVGSGDQMGQFATGHQISDYRITFHLFRAPSVLIHPGSQQGLHLDPNQLTWTTPPTSTAVPGEGHTR